MSDGTIIRILFGYHDQLPKDPWNDPDYAWRFDSVILDIKQAVEHEIQIPFKVIVMGEKNVSLLESIGIPKDDIVLMCKEPYVDEQLYYFNKIHGSLFAAREFKEILLLDWDTLPIKEIPPDFWDDFRNRKGEIQAPLYHVRRTVAHWRRPPLRNRKSLSGGQFTYYRNADLLQDMLSYVGDKNMQYQCNDETYISRKIDDLMGGFNIEKYYENHEPKWCHLRHSSFEHPECCFIHPVKTARKSLTLRRKMASSSIALRLKIEKERQEAILAKEKRKERRLRRLHRQQKYQN